MFTPGQEIEVSDRRQWIKVLYIGRTRLNHVVYEDKSRNINYVHESNCRMLKQKKEGWVTIMKYTDGALWTSGPHASKHEAETRAFALASNVIAIVKVEWEE